MNKDIPNIKELANKYDICNPQRMATDEEDPWDRFESIDRIIRKHPAKIILYRIKNWIFDLLWPKDVYGINRPGNCLDDSHLYRSDCKACNRPIDPKLKKALHEAIKDIKPFWKKAIWITGEDRDE